MNMPHAPRTATALPLDDNSQDTGNNSFRGRDASLRTTSRPIPVPAHTTSRAGASLTPNSRRHDHAYATLSTSPLSSFTLPDVSVTTPPLAHFRADTIAPTSIQEGELPQPHSNTLSIGSPAIPRRSVSPVGSLRISTDFATRPVTPDRRESFNNSNGNGSGSSRGSLTLNHRASSNSLHPISRTPSLKAALTNSLGSASGTSSLVPSPIISAMGDMTPLPSPLMSGDSPGPWKRLSAGSASPPQQRLKSVGEGSVLVTSTGESIDAALSNGAKRKIYSTLEPGDHVHTQSPSNQQPRQHTRNRSVSEYVPDPMGIPKRQISVSARPNAEASARSHEPQLRRELNLAESRGLTPSVVQPPTPPPSESSRDSADGAGKPKGPRFEYFEANGRNDKKRRRWRAVRMLGQGTFSRVMLATSQIEPDEDSPEVDHGRLTPKPEQSLDRKTLVAVKVCEHGPKGGASEERVEMSLKRELEIMLSIHHPSLVDLKAWSIEPTRAILVLSYCPGGDMFDIATSHRSVLKEPLLRRIFAEMVGAVSYLHERRIVHRDIKLENVLVNLTPSELADPSIDWATYPYSVVILSDLGLSRRIADDEKLETRCGSEDYAAPEVIMGQPYDGRATDAWSLGVLLYALLEARLPFDPHPGMSEAHRMRSRTSHRIARVEWKWVEYYGDDTDHDGDETKFKQKGLLGAMEITEGLLRRARGRWTVDKVTKTPWVQGAINVEGGIRFREEKDGEEVS
ncbi:CAMK kinase [Fusarium pseudocircinatum]|uniref:CAMK kinase n=1 Tax=Fusarium pseudocircinatum TaxID=56676 RepID=A0A8H5PZ70_9HYPO|nr:CAMK kinase [Fusarium pseudocircinatum]